VQVELGTSALGPWAFVLLPRVYHDAGFSFPYTPIPASAGRTLLLQLKLLHQRPDVAQHLLTLRCLELRMHFFHPPLHLPSRFLSSITGATIVAGGQQTRDRVFARDVSGLPLITELRVAATKGKPFGTIGFTGLMVERFGLELATKKRGRQKKGT